MTYSINDIIEFVEDHVGARNVQPTDDIFGDLGCVGDDFHELIDKYAKKFQVDVSAYLWYFHADEEGYSIGRLFFKPPYERVTRIPITPDILLLFANSGKWDITYPGHTLPKSRKDLLINGIFVCVLLAYILYVVAKEYIFS